MRAKDIMSTPIITAHPETSLKEIADTLVRHDIGAIPIVDDTGELLGLVTEADVIRLQTIPDPRLHAIPLIGREQEHVPTQASEVMTINVVTRTEDEDVTSIARLMLTLHLKHVPIVSGKKVTGIISRRDILKVLARSDQSIEAELQERLDDEIMLLGWFHARVSDGVATMTGPDEKDARRLARLIARSIPGVVAVEFDEKS
jgi:CBS domain-containing protein